MSRGARSVITTRLTVLTDLIGLCGAENKNTHIVLMILRVNRSECTPVGDE